MDHQDSNKRFKSANGSPITISHANAAASLPAYQPPPAIGARGVASPAASAAASSASVDRSTTNKLRLTVKAPPSKLRQATSSSQQHQAPIPPNPYSRSREARSESDVTPAPARAKRNAKVVVEQPESEDELEDDEDMDHDVDQELLAHEDSDDDAEGEDEDLEGHPPPPVFAHINASAGKPPGIAVHAPPPNGPLKSVEAKELAEEDDDDESLSSLDDEEDETNLLDHDNDELSSSDINDDDDENSRSATPDLSKLTRRQRGAHESDIDGSLMALSNEAQKKKHLTAEEHAMRRAEMARRRKNLSEKKNEEEKAETINKLLSKPSAPKRRTRAEILIAQQQAESGATPPVGTDAVEWEAMRTRAVDPLFVRWVSGRGGVRLGVPGEWMGEGGLFGGIGGVKGGGGGGRMVVEVVEDVGMRESSTPEIEKMAVACGF
ncbi:hypothetical protein LTR08_007947 [Meristemomyces frigidus]|nr:hypothetical protein LTR08_007947 [Meristemomyces frigidus]